MVHFFDSEVAKEYGILEAVIINHLEFWISKNKANQVNFHDGEYWTYNSSAAFQEIFPYASKRQIERALQKLRDEGIIMVGNYNEMKYDRTLWYAFTKKGKCISRFGEMDITEMENGCHQSVTPIPDKYTDNNSYKETDKNGDKPHKHKFSPPSVDDVRAYCQQRNNSVDPVRFVDYYTSNGWRVGKNPMKDWKAAVRTWERNNIRNQNQEEGNPFLEILREEEERQNESCRDSEDYVTV